MDGDESVAVVVVGDQTGAPLATNQVRAIDRAGMRAPSNKIEFSNADALDRASGSSTLDTL